MELALAAARGVAPAAAPAAPAACWATQRAAWCLPPSAMVSGGRGRRAAGRRAVPALAAAVPSSESGSGSGNGAPNGVRRPALVQQVASQLGTLHPAGGSAADGGGAAAAESPRSWTKFVAETLLPTQHGKFRLRGYRHTVGGGLGRRVRAWVSAWGALCRQAVVSAAVLSQQCGLHIPFCGVSGLCALNRNVLHCAFTAPLLTAILPCRKLRCRTTAG